MVAPSIGHDVDLTGAQTRAHDSALALFANSAPTQTDLPNISELKWDGLKIHMLGFFKNLEMYLSVFDPNLLLIAVHALICEKTNIVLFCEGQAALLDGIARPTHDFTWFNPASADAAAYPVTDDMVQTRYNQQHRMRCATNPDLDPHNPPVITPGTPYPLSNNMHISPFILRNTVLGLIADPATRHQLARRFPSDGRLLLAHLRELALSPLSTPQVNSLLADILDLEARGVTDDSVQAFQNWGVLYEQTHGNIPEANAARDAPPIQAHRFIKALIKGRQDVGIALMQHFLANRVNDNDPQAVKEAIIDFLETRKSVERYSQRHLPAPARAVPVIQAPPSQSEVKAFLATSLANVAADQNTKAAIDKLCPGLTDGIANALANLSVNDGDPRKHHDNRGARPYYDNHNGARHQHPSSRPPTYRNQRTSNGPPNRPNRRYPPRDAATLLSSALSDWNSTNDYEPTSLSCLALDDTPAAPSQPVDDSDALSKLAQRSALNTYENTIHNNPFHVLTELAETDDMPIEANTAQTPCEQQEHTEALVEPPIRKEPLSFVEFCKGYEHLHREFDEMRETTPSTPSKCLDTTPTPSPDEPRPNTPPTPSKCLEAPPTPSFIELCEKFGSPHELSGELNYELIATDPTADATEPHDSDEPVTNASCLFNTALLPLTTPQQQLCCPEHLLQKEDFDLDDIKALMGKQLEPHKLAKPLSAKAELYSINKMFTPLAHVNDDELESITSRYRSRLPRDDTLSPPPYHPSSPSPPATSPLTLSRLPSLSPSDSEELDALAALASNVPTSPTPSVIEAVLDAIERDAVPQPTPASPLVRPPSPPAAPPTEREESNCNTPPRTSTPARVASTVKRKRVSWADMESPRAPAIYTPTTSGTYTVNPRHVPTDNVAWRAAASSLAHTKPWADDDSPAFSFMLTANTPAKHVNDKHMGREATATLHIDSGGTIHMYPDVEDLHNVRECHRIITDTRGMAYTATHVGDLYCSFATDSGHFNGVISDMYVVPQFPQATLSVKQLQDGDVQVSFGPRPNLHLPGGETVPFYWNGRTYATYVIPTTPNNITYELQTLSATRSFLAPVMPNAPEEQDTPRVLLLADHARTAVLYTMLSAKGIPSHRFTGKPWYEAIFDDEQYRQLIQLAKSRAFSSVYAVPPTEAPCTRGKRPRSASSWVLPAENFLTDAESHKELRRRLSCVLDAARHAHTHVVLDTTYPGRHSDVRPLRLLDQPDDERSPLERYEWCIVRTEAASANAPPRTISCAPSQQHVFDHYRNKLVINSVPHQLVDDAIAHLLSVPKLSPVDTPSTESTTSSDDAPPTPDSPPCDAELAAAAALIAAAASTYRRRRSEAPQRPRMTARSSATHRGLVATPWSRYKPPRASDHGTYVELDDTKTITALYLNTFLPEALPQETPAMPYETTLRQDVLHACMRSSSPLPSAEHTRFQAIRHHATLIARSTRPDITYAIGLLNLVVHPTSALVQAAEHLVKYLWGTRHLGLRYKAYKQEATTEDATIQATRIIHWETTTINFKRCTAPHGHPEIQHNNIGHCTLTKLNDQDTLYFTPTKQENNARAANDYTTKSRGTPCLTVPCVPHAKSKEYSLRGIYIMPLSESAFLASRDTILCQGPQAV